MQIGTDVMDYCHRQWGVAVHPPVELPVFDHQFTHFKLRIRPQLLHVVSNNSTGFLDCIWLKPSEAIAQGIPAPVRTLLKQNFLTGDTFPSPLV